MTLFGLALFDGPALCLRGRYGCASVAFGYGGAGDPCAVKPRQGTLRPSTNVAA